MNLAICRLTLLLACLVAPIGVAFRLNCGGAAFSNVVADSALYQATPVQSYDQSAGRVASVYNSQAWMPNRAVLVYEFSVPNVAHVVRLHFAEIYSGAAFPGARIISVIINNKLIAQNVDIWSLAGDQLFSPVTYEEINVFPVNGKISVRVVSKVQNAMISGIDIEGSSPATPTPLPIGSLFRLNAGGAALPGGVVADASLYNSATGANVFSFSPNLGGVPSVYNSHAYTQSVPLKYEFYVSEVSHTVTLRFAEIFSGAARLGGRLLSLSINGVTFKTNVDIYTLAGSKMFTGVDFVRKHVFPVAGKITIEVRGLVENAMISGIDIEVGRPLVGSGSWRLASTTGPIVARHEACAVMVGGKVYLIGGRGTRATNEYDPVTKIYVKKSIPPVEMNHMQCVGYKNRYVYVAASWFGSFPREQTHNVTYVYDTVGDTWATEPGLGARARGSGAFVFYQGKFYLAFGNRGGHGAFATSLTEFDSYDPVTQTWTALPDAPNARDHVGGAIIGHRLCAGGGRDGGAANFWESPTLPINCYNFQTATWEVHPDLPEGRAGAATGATCDGLLMIAGGEGRVPGTAGQAFARVDLYDPETRTFKTPTNLTDSRHGSGLGVADCRCGNIYLPSGSGGLGGSPELLTTEVWSPDGVARDC